MKTVKLIVFVVFSVILIASLGLAASHYTFKAKLTGKEVVQAVTTEARGEAYFKVGKDGKLNYLLKVKNIEDVTAAHIHAGKKGEEGAPIAGLFAGPKKTGKFSGELAKGTIADKDLVGTLAGKSIADLLKLMKEGGAYVNVHTDKHPAGEIRGQIK